MVLWSYFVFWLRMIRYAATGRFRFYAWILFLLCVAVPGGYYYFQQLQIGMAVTNLSDQVAWGAYISNFSFLVGLAGAAVLMVIPAYVLHHKPAGEVVMLGQLLGAAALIMAMLFIVVDIGHPERATHMLPYLGRLNFPMSILAWDTVVLNGYLILHLHIVGYLLFMRYLGRTPNKWVYLPFVFISIGWALSTHTVGAFLYGGLGGRPYWNSAILAPRFIISAFVGAPALLSITFHAIRATTHLQVSEQVFNFLKKTVAITMPVNMFLLFCEIFTEFYADKTHVAASHYLFFGLGDAHMLRPYIWGSITLNTLAMLVFVFPFLRDRLWLFLPACFMAIVGTWSEKAMGLIIPGFVPSPLGDIVEYQPSVAEFFICLAIWAIGAIIYTLFAKVAIGVITGELRESKPGST